jgi:hypothetical protein
MFHIVKNFITFIPTTAHLSKDKISLICDTPPTYIGLIMAIIRLVVMRGKSSYG